MSVGSTLAPGGSVSSRISSNLPKVFYLGDPYISHRLAAQGNCQALAELGCLTDDLERADIVVIHQELSRLKSTLERLPAVAGKYLVAFLVWETIPLRDRDLPVIAQVDEVWTPALFCVRAFMKAHRQVYLMPHVVPDAAAPAMPSKQAGQTHAEALVEGWLAPAKAACFVLGVAQHVEERKNLPQLRKAVQAARRRAPSLVFVMKSRSDTAMNEPNVVYSPGEIDIRGPVDPAVMLALTKRCPITASAHRAEGWGLTLSDGLRLGKWVVATNYSASTALLNANNGLPVDYNLRKIGESGGRLSFNKEAVWANPWQVHLEDQLVEACNRELAGSHQDVLRTGPRDMARYSAKRLKLLLHARLQAIAVAHPSLCMAKK